MPALYGLAEVIGIGSYPTSFAWEIRNGTSNRNVSDGLFEGDLAVSSNLLAHLYIG